MCCGGVQDFRQCVQIWVLPTDLPKISLFFSLSPRLWGRRGFTRQPENSKRAHFRAPRFKHHQNSTKGPPERVERTNYEGEKKREILGPTPLLHEPCLPTTEDGRREEVEQISRRFFQVEKRPHWPTSNWLESSAPPTPQLRRRGNQTSHAIPTRSAAIPICFRRNVKVCRTAWDPLSSTDCQVHRTIDITNVTRHPFSDFGIVTLSNTV